MCLINWQIAKCNGRIRGGNKIENGKSGEDSQIPQMSEDSDDSEQATKKGEYPWEKPYSKVPIKQVEKRIGTTMIELSCKIISPERWKTS